MSDEYYFAYGSNMDVETMDRVGGTDAEFIAPASLENHRLAFTRRTTKTKLGVADIVPATRCSVWGALYRITPAVVAELDRKEGHPTAYERVRVDVEAKVDGKTPAKKYLDVLTYSVTTKEEFEVVPSEAYMNRILHGAADRRLPERYQAFLQHLADLRGGHADGSDFRLGPYLTTTADRSASKGFPVIRVNPQLARDLGARKFIAIERDTEFVIGRLVTDPTIPMHQVEADQALRRALGMEGFRAYGYTVELRRVIGTVPVTDFIGNRTLALRVAKPYVGDSEKDVAVINVRNLRLLGVDEGAYLKVMVATQPDGLESVRINRLVLRSFAGTATEIHPEALGGAPQDYPLVDRIYLDADTRNQLGVKDRIGYPVLIQASVVRSLVARMVVYGLSFFLGISAFLELLAALAGRWSPVARGLASLGLSALLTVVIAFLETRSRLRSH